jgi:hypothetical protein
VERQLFTGNTARARNNILHEAAAASLGVSARTYAARGTRRQEDRVAGGGASATKREASRAIEAVNQAAAVSIVGAPQSRVRPHREQNLPVERQPS